MMFLSLDAIVALAIVVVAFAMPLTAHEAINCTDCALQRR
jgi:hypothetical protein